MTSPRRSSQPRPRPGKKHPVQVRSVATQANKKIIFIFSLALRPGHSTSSRNDGRAGGIRRGGVHERRGLSVFRGCGCAGGKQPQGGDGQAGDDEEMFHKLNSC